MSDELPDAEDLQLTPEEGFHPIALNFEQDLRAVFARMLDEDVNGFTATPYTMPWPFFEWLTEWLVAYVDAATARTGLASWDELQARRVAGDLLEFAHYVADVEEAGRVENPEDRQAVILAQQEAAAERLRATVEEMETRINMHRCVDTEVQRRRREARREGVVGVRIIQEDESS